MTSTTTHVPDSPASAAAAPPSDPVIGALYVVFLLSGAAGLIYESIWTRYLGLFVGHSAYAQVIVLVMFLGGMSVGSYLIGRRTLSIARPLVWYAVIELAIGVVGLLFHTLFVVTTGAAYDHVFPAIGFGPLQTLVKWAVAAALILPQSVLLGMTFPLMSAGVVRRMPARAGRALSMLYFTNSAGAAIGVLVAGFWLVRIVGLPGTLVSAAIINLVVALSVITLVRAARDRADGSAPIKEPRPTATAWAPDRRWRLLIATSFATALSSFIYEIGWIRMLSLVLGSATHSFELMLSAFILGLALGALWIGRRADAARSLRMLAIVQLAMGALAIATLPVYLSSFNWMASFMSAFARTNEGYVAFSLARYAICLAVMLPATVCAGMTLPLITRALIQGSAGERAIGQVYAINTLGSIVGAGLAGLVLMPLLGVKWLLVAGATIDLAVGALLFVEYAGRAQLFTARRAIVAVAGVVVLAVIVGGSTFDQTVLSSGVYRYGTTQAPGSRDVIFYRDGRTATVSVRRQPTGALTLSTNGKPDGSLGPEWLSSKISAPGQLTYDAPTQLFMPLVPLAHLPKARTAVVIGQGTGMTSHALLGSPHLTRVVTVEIEPEMMNASRLFLPANRRAFDDPRSTFVIDDARAFFATQRERFDLIVSEPSNPWVSGVSGLFTTEFYARVRDHLALDGVFAQWLHLSEIDDGLVLSVLSAINDHFPSWSIFAISNRDIVIVASPAATMPEPDWSVLRFTGVASDLRVTWPITNRTMEQLRLADRATLEPLLKRGSISNSDYYPTLDLNAERTRFTRTSAAGLAGLTHGVNVSAMVSGRRAGLGDSYAIIPGIDRLSAMSVNAAMRSGDSRGGEPAQAARERVRVFEADLGNGGAPADWHTWVRGFTQAAEIVHGGMSGVADTAFFTRVERYLARHKAPAEARAAVAFTRGIAAWNYREAAAAADLLIRAAARQDDWLDPDYLSDGAVMSMLRVGDPRSARDAFREMGKRSARPASDLGRQLMLSYVIDASAGLNAKGVPPR